MTESEKFKTLLKDAAKAAQRKAARKGIPYAISVNGKIEIIRPEKSAKARKRKHKVK
ncbi:MAG TPA: hypothetical protein VK543_02500 [Puia sp.]|nr:hypothetical protein [Puia sp.]